MQQKPAGNKPDQRGMTNAGYGVLRIDFTGLGESEGDFSNTNFTSNLDDLVAAESTWLHSGVPQGY